MASSKSSAFSPIPVLPPIVTNEKDRLFLTELSDWIRDQLSKINEHDVEQCYIVYKEVFSKIIDYVSAYRPLMTGIKSQYENVIDVLVRGRQETFYLRGKLSEMANAPGTLRNYQRRAEDLETKIAIIERDNSRLKEQCRALQLSREDRDNRNKDSKSLTSHRRTEEKSDKCTRAIPGLTLEQATDVDVLKWELEKLDRQHRELSIGSRTRYVPKECRDQLKNELVDRAAKRDRLQADVERLRRSELLMRVAAESAQAYLKIQLPHQTIGDAVLLALARAAAEASDIPNLADVDALSSGYSQTVDGSDDLDAESIDDRDADAMLDYIEQFNELMEDKRYDEAAVHAANGVRGILRTQETMQRFLDLPTRWRQPDDVSDVTSAGPVKPSPLLTFCSALMSTVPAFRTKPTEQMSSDCVRCALRENRIDLVTHWISQDRVSLSESIGDLLYEHATRKRSTDRSQFVAGGGDDACLSLAQKVYVDAGANVSAVVCMALRGRTGAALRHAEQTGCRTPELVQALRRCPSRLFADALYTERDSRGRCFLPLGVIISTLLQTDAYDTGLDLIEAIFDKERSSDSDADIESSVEKRRAFQTAVIDDEITTGEEWSEIARLCRSRGNEDCASELLASVIAVLAIRDAIGRADEQNTVPDIVVDRKLSDSQVEQPVDVDVRESGER